MKVFCSGILVAACLGFATCQNVNDIDVDDVKKKIGETIPELDGIDTSKFNTSQLPSQEEVENRFREKCKQKGAENAVDFVKDQQEVVISCIEQYINQTLVIEELDEAKKTGSMDDVLGKYCKKWPSIYACFDNVIATTRTCLDQKEEEAFNKTLNITQELQKFMCFKDGDRLAMFIAEDGMECIAAQKEGIERCVNSTVGAKIPQANDFSTATLPTFLFSSKDCEDFDKLRKCVNVELEKCKNTTPANVVDALFKFLRKQMTCSGASLQRSPSGSIRSFSVSSVLVIVCLIKLRLF